MRNPKLSPVVYEYRYNHLSDNVRNSVLENRNSLFDRSTKNFSNVEKSNKAELLIAKVGVLCGIALVGFLVSIII